MSLGVLAVGFASCQSGDVEFPDYEKGTTVYFPYQYPVRTIALGDEEYDTSMDQAHKCQILATFGGSYKGSNGMVQVQVDNSLVQGLTFADGTPVKAMPESYYKLATTTFNFGGTYNGGTEVQLTDAFFADPDAVKNTYVIPVVMTQQTGFGQILTGEVAMEGATPARTDAGAWKVKPMDYTLYCVKYQNKYTGYWLAEGQDKITDETGIHTVDRKSKTVETRPVVQLKTKSMNSCVLTVSYQFDYMELVLEKKPDGTEEWVEKMLTHTISADLLVTFDGSENATITSLTEGVTASGTGKWVDNGAKKAWNNKDRDLLDLSYSVDFGGNYGIHKVNLAASTTDNLIWQRSGIKVEEFSPIYNK